MTQETQADLNARRAENLTLPWRDIGGAPKDGTRIWLFRISDRGGWAEPEIGYYRIAANGYEGWFNDAGEYLGNPDSWMPLEGERMH